MSNWRKTLLSGSATVRDAIQSLNRSSLQIVLVADSRRRLLGTITDGDIRRWLIKGHGMDSCVLQMMRKNPRVVCSGQGRQEVLSVMRRYKLSTIPEIDENGKIIKLHRFGDYLSLPRKKIKSLFVIMAGGFGKRLHPYTIKIPKPMMKIRGRPILEHILKKASQEGFNDFVITTHHLAHIIRNYFRTGEKMGVNIQYVHENKPLGTAGSLRLIKTNKEPVVITNGDVLSGITYAEILNYHKSRKAKATMAVKAQIQESEFGVVEVQGFGIRKFREKPVSVNFINAGIYVLEPDVISLIPRDQKVDMPTVFKNLISQKQKTNVFPIHEAWEDVGTLEKYKKINAKQIS